jgi:hypothetical protein
MTDKKLHCHVVIDQTELYQNPRYTMAFDPEEFLLDRVSSSSSSGSRTTSHDPLTPSDDDC